MPRQPKVKSNDPNRRKGTRGGAFAALAQQTSGPDTTQQYSSAGPNLVQNNTTADNLTVGKTFGGPVGTSAWTELSQLLGTGMQAATTGAQIYGQFEDRIEYKKKKIEEEREKADSASDTEAQKEYELEAAQLEIDIQTFDEDKQHAERGKLLAKYEDRFVTDSGRHRHNLAGLKHELGTSHADATAWMRININEKVSQARLTYSKDPAALANALTEIYEEGSKEIIKRHGEDSKLYSSYMQIVAGGVQSAQSLVKNTARQMVRDNAEPIAEARKSLVMRMSQGEDVLGELGLNGASTLGAYAAAIFEEAGIDLSQLDPYQASAVEIEFRDMMLNDLKDDIKALQDADDSRIQQQSRTLLDAEITEWDNSRDGRMSEDSIDTLMAARERWAQTSPGTQEKAKVDEGLIRSFIEGSITRLDIDMSDEDRKTFVETKVGEMLATWDYDNDDPLARKVRARAAKVLKETDFNVIRGYLEKKDHLGLLKAGAHGSGPEAELAYKLGMEQMGITMSDYFGQEAIMLFNMNQVKTDADPRMAALSSQIGNNGYRMNEDQANRAKDSLGIAYRAAVNGEDFETVLKEELEIEGLGDRFEQVMSSVSASKSGQLLYILDQEKSDNVGRPETVREATNLYKSLGGEFKDGNLQGGLKVSTDESRMLEHLGKPAGQRAVGATVSEAMGDRPDVMDTAAYEKDVGSFVTAVVASPGFVNAFQAEPDTAKRLTMLTNVFTARYGNAPPQIALEMMEQQINEGGFKSDDQATIVSQIGETFAAAKRQAVNKAVTQDRSYGGNWNSVKGNLDVMASIARFVEPPQEINEITAAGWASQRGLVITREEGSGNINITVDPERGPADLLMSLNENVPGEAAPGNRMVGANFNPEAKKALTDYAQGTALVLDGNRNMIANPESVEAMQVFVEALVARPGSALNSPANKFGLEGEEAKNFDRLRNCIRGKRSSTNETNNLEHGRLAFASALLAEGIPVSEWNIETFDLISSDTEGEYMRRGTDGSLTFIIPGEANEAPMTLIVPPAFSGSFGGVARNRDSALTGAPAGKALAFSHATTYYAMKDKVDKQQNEIRERLGDRASSDPNYIEEWKGNEILPKNLDYSDPKREYPFKAQAMGYGTDEDQRYTF